MQKSITTKYRVGLMCGYPKIRVDSESIPGTRIGIGLVFGLGIDPKCDSMISSLKNWTRDSDSSSRAGIGIGLDSKISSHPVLLCGYPKIRVDSESIPGTRIGIEFVFGLGIDPKYDSVI